MAKAKIISAALVAGIASTGAQAASVSDDTLITTAPGGADTLLFVDDFKLHGDIPLALAPSEVRDQWDIGVETAQTCCGTPSQDTVQGSSAKVKKPAKGITLDNGIKKKGKVKPQQAGAKKKKKN
ncbi:MAG: hypothetical protein AAGB15_08550 [Pseudomonadota bacterium]